LILRQSHAGGYPLSLVAGDGVNSEDFWLVAGPAGENTLFTSYPDFRGISTATSVTAKFRAQGYEPSGSTLHAYAAVQAWAEAVQRSGSVALEPVAEVLRRDQFPTILGPIGFDDKGNVEGKLSTGTSGRMAR
jgi:branched-chain amino acid transport system substrate-binding protein